MSAYPAINFPYLTHILLAYNLLKPLVWSNIRLPLIINSSNIGGSTSNITFQAQGISTFDPY